MTITTQQFADALGLGPHRALLRVLEQVFATAHAPDEEYQEALELSATFDALATYKHTFNFPLPASVMDAFAAQYLGKVAEERKVYYAVLSLLWRADLAHAKALLQKRIESLT
jgi:chaperonin cofactor prefoldin